MNMTQSSPSMEELTESVEKLEGIVKKVRLELKEARAESSESRKWREKYYAARDSAELWQHRAKKNLERLNALTIKTSSTQNAKD